MDIFVVNQQPQKPQGPGCFGFLLQCIGAIVVIIFLLAFFAGGNHPPR